MTESFILVTAGAILVITVLSGSLKRFWLTETLIATVFGLVLGLFVIGPMDLENPVVLTFLELALALVLFSDASRVSIRSLKG
ncbi:MAG: sodium:proton antiporter, partial [Acidimicrobiia bacterium]